MAIGNDPFIHSTPQSQVRCCSELCIHRTINNCEYRIGGTADTRSSIYYSV